MMDGRVATSLDTRVHLTTTLGWSNDAKAMEYMKELVLRADPILRAHGWRVYLYFLFFPKDMRLLGLNVNRGQEVCIRFRRPTDRNSFFPLEAVVGTMLHELVHCKISPHNKSFWALYNTLVSEEEERDLQRALGGHRLGTQSYFATAPRRCPLPTAVGGGGGGGGDGGDNRPSVQIRPSNTNSTTSSFAGRRLGGGDLADSLTRRPMNEILAEAALRRNPPLPPSTGVHDEEEADLENTIAGLALQGCSQSICPADRRRRLRSDEKEEWESYEDDANVFATVSSTAAPSSSSSPTTSWECPRCHFHNHALLYPVCEMCSDEDVADTSHHDGDQAPLRKFSAISTFGEDRMVAALQLVATPPLPLHLTPPPTRSLLPGDDRGVVSFVVDDDDDDDTVNPCKQEHHEASSSGVASCCRGGTGRKSDPVLI
ncbi:metallopeptidase, putative [Bodo saltans]|uniref:Metallopeptidase, putative n=1 Tax=Bodo saltans TaxID=75058 RepID=A0A0S4JA65_BODSA|nr:metallopeptidase, putative [Bodo saltans]|eukprot:CUG80422.1 metallopeptidase, putative [Bodo saltans]